MEIITVLPGDTVNEIALRYGLNSEKIISDNGLDDTGSLVPGQSLILLFPDQEYIVSDENQTVNDVAFFSGINNKILFRNNFFLGGQNNLNTGDILVLSYQSQPISQKIIGGYAYDSISQQLLESVISYMTYLMPFTYGFTSTGELVPPDDQRLIDTALAFGAKPLLHLSTLTEEGNFSNELANQLLSNQTAIETLYDNILSVVAQKGYYGVDVDFEFLFAQDRDRYTAFIAGLTERLNAEGLISVVALPPKTSDDQPGLLYEGIDYAGLGNAANYGFLMTYEWGYRFGPACATNNTIRLESRKKRGSSRLFLES